jgi:hypothetical protein
MKYLNEARRNASQTIKNKTLARIGLADEATLAVMSRSRANSCGEGLQCSCKCQGEA